MGGGMEFLERVGGRSGLSVILDALKWDEQGLVAVVTQDVDTKEVLGVAFANRIAVEKTIETGLMHYYSRSRKKQWMKGEESGHVQKVVEIRTDCYGNSILLLVRQKGPGACHTGHRSCFYRKVKGGRLVVTDRVRFDPLKVYGKGK